MNHFEDFIRAELSPYSRYFIWLCSLAIRISGMALSIVSGLFAVAGIVYMITESLVKVVSVWSSRFCFVPTDCPCSRRGS
jgi:hypothetical protein